MYKVDANDLPKYYREHSDNVIKYQYKSKYYGEYWNNIIDS